MAKLPKPPAPRGFTIQEARALSIEKRTFHLTWVVALLAATMSFVALQWVGVQMGMYSWIAPLLPLAIDGLGIICSFGIIRSAGAKEPFRNRASEWAGLGLSLLLSMAGNAAHALESVPWWLKIVYSVAVPVIVAYSIHVLGRYMDSGVSAHILVDDPDQIHFGLAQLGEGESAQSAPTARASETKVPAQARAQSPAMPAQARVQSPAQDARPTSTPPRAMPALVSAPSGEQARARQLFDAAIAADPDTKPDAAAIHREAGIEKDKATVRRWVSKWWDDQQAVAEPDRDPILEQMDDSRMISSSDSSPEARVTA